MVISVLKNTLMITGFIFVMMLVIEYLNVLTRGGWDKSLGRWKWGQVFFTALLGSAPGCLGSYAVGSLYMHRVVTVGALMAAMIATCGDETFVMLAMFPGKTMLILSVLFVLGIVTGLVVDVVLRRRRTQETIHHNDYHATHEGEERCVPFSRGEMIGQWRKCTPERGLLSLMLVLFLTGVLSGGIAHNHLGVEPAESGVVAVHESVDGEHGHATHEGEHKKWDWTSITLFMVGIMGLLIVATVPDHFLQEHLWDHLVKVHIWKIFLWTFASLLIVHVLLEYININSIVSNGASLPLLIAACLIGIIPESGPHLVFVMLYAEGSIAFSILLANCIVQDGHGMIPVLAHSRRAFAAVKGGKFLLGLSVGLLGHFMGW